MPDLLYEIGAEEIPAGYIGPALEQLARRLDEELTEAGLDHGAVAVTGTPRRLVVTSQDVAERQPDVEEEVTGPPAKIAFDAEGNPTKAAQGFARSQGVAVEAIRRADTDRGEYCVVTRHTTGRPAIELLAEILPRITLQISFPKSMLWPESDRPFARPVRWLAALLGDEVISFELFGVTSDRSIELHPILNGGRAELANADAEAYRETLRQGCVVVESAEREATIRKGIETALEQFGGALREEDLLREVVNLVQYPSVSVGGFDREFLDVPAKVVEAAMMEHQRYFPVLNGAGELEPHFIVVSDRGPEPSDAVRVGNEEVLRARLADARFFYEVDRKRSLEAFADELDGIQFLRGLGTYRDKALRLDKLAEIVAEALGMDRDTMAQARRAAQLCKADLLTEMVGEFPRLQGEVGRIYAIEDGETQAVADAIVEHYWPRSAEGDLPQSACGLVLSLAEKLDNLTACFAIGRAPSSSADPFALRRQGQAALRILIESGRHVSLDGLLREAQALLPAPARDAEDAVEQLLEFLGDRLFQMALDDGAPHDLIRAVMAAGRDDVVDFRRRLEAVRELSHDTCWQRLVEAVERTHNISRGAPSGLTPDPALYAEPLEKELGELYDRHHEEIENLEAEGEYAEAGRRYAKVFADPLHTFFDNVFVNVDDEAVRNNRLALLRTLNRLFAGRIADLSQIVTGVEKS